MNYDCDNVIPNQLITPQTLAVTSQTERHDAAIGPDAEMSSNVSRVSDVAKP